MPEFKHGQPIMADHTPDSAVTAGDVIVLEDCPRIAHRDIAAGEVGALAISGGIYEMIADAEIEIGVDLYWDAAEEKVSETDTGNAHIGQSISYAAADDATILVYHQPKALTGSE